MKRMIIALIVISSGLLVAIIALTWQGWANSQIPKTVIIPSLLELQARDINWHNYLAGAMMFSGLISSLFVYGQTPRKRITCLLGAGAAWGCVSWFAGIFTVVAGLWGVFATLYGLKRFQANGLSLTTKPQDSWPLLDSMTLQTNASLLVGSGFSAGLKFGFAAALIQFAAGLFSWLVLLALFEIGRWLIADAG